MGLLYDDVITWFFLTIWSEISISLLFDEIVTNGRTDRPTDRPTDRRTHPLIESWLTTKKKIWSVFCVVVVVVMVVVVVVVDVTVVAEKSHSRTLNRCFLKKKWRKFGRCFASPASLSSSSLLSLPLLPLPKNFPPSLPFCVWHVSTLGRCCYFDLRIKNFSFEYR